VEVPELQFYVHAAEEGGYWAECHIPENALFTQGENLDELHHNVAEVSMLYLETLADDLGAEVPSEAKFSLHFVEPVEQAA